MFETWEILPIWLYILATQSLLTTLRTYIPSLSRPTLKSYYSQSAYTEATALSARHFGTWSALQALVSIHAGLSIHDRGAYTCGLIVYVLVLLHCLFERVATRTMGGRSLSLLEGTAFVTVWWMFVQRGVYCEPSDTPPMGPEESLMHPWEGAGQMYGRPV